MRHRPLIIVAVVFALIVGWLSEMLFHVSQAFPLAPVAIAVVAAVLTYLVGWFIVSHQWLSLRIGSYLLVAFVAVVSTWIFKPAPTPEPRVQPPPTDLTFAGWHLGDVHTHAAGDFDLVDHAECEVKGGGFLPPPDCARSLVGEVLSAAHENGVQWVILVEHGPWLGLDNFPHYDPDEGGLEWSMIEEAADSLATKYGVRALMGEELGTAVLGTPGHFSAYQTNTYIPNDISRTRDVHYVEKVAKAGGWGAINHPYSGGNTWDCWYESSLAGCSPGAAGLAERLDGSQTLPVAFRALEITNGGDFPKTETLDRWDELLVQGLKVWPVGGSDAHTRSRTLNNIVDFRLGVPTIAKVGVSRTFAFVEGDIGPTDGFRSTDADDPIRTSIFEGHTVASNGPLAVAGVGDVIPGGTVSIPVTSHQITLDIRWAEPFSAEQQTPSEVRVIYSATHAGCLPDLCIPDFQLTFTPAPGQHALALPLSIPSAWRSGYIRVEVRGDDGDERLGAFTSPIFIRRTR
jgi:hypothetical protein